MAKNINVLGYVLIVFIIGVMLKIYFESDAFNLKCIVSDVDGNKYCVRERAKIQLVADLLAIGTNCSSLTRYRITASTPGCQPVNRSSILRIAIF